MKLLAALLLALLVGCRGAGPLPPNSPTSCELSAFRAAAIGAAPDEARAALLRWNPPAPVPPPDRGHVVALARSWIERCGLDEAVELTRALVAFPTVSAEAEAPENPAFGGMARALQVFAEENELEFSVYGAHDVWELKLGDGPSMLGFVLHADVAPVGPVVEGRLTDPRAPASGWTHPPFQAEVTAGRLWGRGSVDDKGPIAAVLIALRTLRRFGLEPPAEVTAIIGTAAERSWDGMRRYAAAKRPPAFVISMDAQFPVVIAEAGAVSWGLRIARAPGDGVMSAVGPKIVEAEGGEFGVPGRASLLAVPSAGADARELARQLEVIAAQATAALGPPFRASVRVERDRVRVLAEGLAVRTEDAERGANALWLLARIAQGLRPAPSAAAAMLAAVDARFVGDHRGERLGLAYSHPMMGGLLVAPTRLRTDEEQVTLDVDLRRPMGMGRDEFGASLARAADRLRAEIDPRLMLRAPPLIGDPVVADLSGPLVPTLLELWQHTTGAPGTPVAIRDGTYARLFRGSASFGPSLPGRPRRDHAPDEYIELEALSLSTRLALDAILQITLSSDDP